MENLVFEEFERYSQYFNYEKLRDKTFLITGFDNGLTFLVGSSSIKTSHLSNTNLTRNSFGQVFS